ncbi:MAG: hypothetical protein IK046_05445 [Clostridia bacterium]|nr:hypothetical protein [Clostridia bacterium]
MSNHPYVFVHGMMGWGTDKKLYTVLPYWGMVTGNYIKRINNMGYEAYAPSVSPLGSAWDRACELYAQLTGTRVDYGKAHSAKFGHERYGRTYDKPFVPDWTPERSIHLLGHSFGGPTMRAFAMLLEDGSEEERAATPKEELSPLFEGGHIDLIKSITDIAGPFDGIMFPHALPKLTDIGLYYGLAAVASIIGNIGSGRIYDFQLTQWGLTGPYEGERDWKNCLNFKNIKYFCKSYENVFSDIHIDRAMELNKQYHEPDAYLYTVTGNGTEKDENGNFKRAPIMIFAFAPFANWFGKFRGNVYGVEMTDEWRMNDGIVNVASAIHPLTEKWQDFDAKAPQTKGIWNALPLVPGDHGTVIGGSLSFIGKEGAKRFRDAYDYWIKYLDNLPD